MQHKFIASVFTILTFMTLNSCGWHLRGYPSPGSTDSTGTTLSFSLTADDIYTPLYRTFKNDYEVRRVDLSDTENQPQLKLLGENTRTRILSLNTELDPAESELTYTIRYQISFPAQPPQIHNIHLYRAYIQNKDRISARDNEKNKLIDEMRHEAAEKILNQINTLLMQQKKSP